MIELLSPSQIEVCIKHRVVHGVTHDAVRLRVQPLHQDTQKPQYSFDVCVNL